MTDELRDEDRALLNEMSTDLLRYQPKNARKWAFYDGEAGIKNIGIAIPETMINVESVIGWPEIVVDALEERLDWLGWVGIGESSSGVEGLERVFRQTQLGTEFDKSKLDALVAGVGFLQVTAGDERAGEPRVMATAVSPQQATYRWDARRNRVGSGMVLKAGPEGERLTTLYYPNETVSITKWPDGGEEVHRVEHGRGRCSLIVFPNRMRSGDVRGKSEITKPIRYYTEHAIRTMLGMEYNREIYTTPQRWFKNVEPEQLGFEETDTPWDVVQKGYKVAMNRAVIIPPNPEGDSSQPDTGQYQSAAPTPYIEELKMLAQMVSASSGVPANYLGFATQNPPSADAIRALESRLIKKAERRQALFGQVLKNDLAYVVQSILDDEPADPEFIASLDVRWRDAATPTRAASVDAAGKIVAHGMVPADSPVLLEMAGFTPTQIKQIEQDRTRSVSRALVESIRNRQSQPQDPMIEDLVSRGVDPAREV